MKKRKWDKNKYRRYKEKSTREFLMLDARFVLKEMRNEIKGVVEWCL